MLNNATTTLHHRFKRLVRGAALCAVCALPLMQTAPARAEVTVEMAGVSAAVTGDVTLNKVTGEIGILVESGMPVYLGDRIITSPNSGMQILLLDETVFTIGPDSDVAIDEFVYDPATGDGRIVADMARGVMRFVTGKIPLNNPSSMDINLPVGSIGIRGTIGLIRSVSVEQANAILPGSFDTSDPDTANQQIFMAVNQGPGLARNDTTSRPGAFAVTDQNGNSENITGENFGVFVGSNVVTEPSRFPLGAASFDFSTNLVRTASRSDDDSDRTSSGTSTAQNAASPQQTGLTAGQAQQANAQTGSNMAGSIEVAMAQLGATAASGSQAEITSILGNVDTASSNNNNSSNDPFTYDALRQITSGSVSTGTINIDGADVDYSFSSTVDFANRTIAVLFSNITQTGSGLTGKAGILDGSFNPTTLDYTSSSGNVEFASGDFSYDPNCSSLGCSATATFKDAYNVEFNLSTTTYTSGTDGSATLN
ncbi:MULTISPECIES: FecR domain-containing protein [unclassified Thalassospira]|uniref:FecR family protein n=1 Tax=unclassified Thalassospira TaxID=2648997 RepID=UPI001B16BC4B|nr:FecR domain-containing protein [Thalassospira sp.]MBO6773333.1 FecR domain-containing protein [Thalassospira sp.]